MADNALVRLQTPVEAMGAVLPVANALTQFQGKQAAGQAMQQATDPDTGVVDPLKFNRLIAANPLARAAMQEAVGQSQGLQGQQQGLANSRNGQIGSMLGAVLDLPDAKLHDGAASALDRAVTMGIIPAQQATALAMKLPNDPAALRTTLRQAQISLMGPDAQRSAIYGTPADQDNGQSIISGVRAPVEQGGGFRGATATQVYPSRSQLIQPVQGTDEQGRPNATPLGTLTSRAGAGALTGPAGGSIQPQAGTGGSVPMGASPVAMANQEADVKAYRTDLAGVPQTEQRIQTLQEARSALQAARTGKGPAGGTLQSVLSVINTVSPETAKSIANAAGTDVEKYDLAKKYLTDYARQSGAATNSDAQLAAAQGSNASVEITNQAAQDVVSLQIGRERQRLAQVQEHADKNGIGYGQHASSFAGNTDARGFAWDTYTPEQQASIRKGVQGNATAERRLAKSIGVAKRLGMLGGQ